MDEEQQSLSRQLAALQRSMRSRMAAPDLATLAMADAEVAADVASRPMLQVGDTAPDFTLLDQNGCQVRLAERLAQGPVVLQFSRGGWCPFCTLQLRAWQEALSKLHDAGGDLLSILPQRAEACGNAAERDLLAFPVLADPGSLVAERYRVAIDLPAVIRPLYKRMGHDLSQVNGAGNWRLPLSSTFVVAADGRIELIKIGLTKPDLLDPQVAVAAVAAMHAWSGSDAGVAVRS